jgi:hypothetical protein
LLTEKIEANTLVRIAFVFCIPHFYFGASGLHKDGFIFMAVALGSFYFNEWMKRKRIFFEGIFHIYSVFICAIFHEEFHSVFIIAGFINMVLVQSLS